MSMTKTISAMLRKVLDSSGHDCTNEEFIDSLVIDYLAEHITEKDIDI